MVILEICTRMSERLFPSVVSQSEMKKVPFKCFKHRKVHAKILFQNLGLRWSPARL